MTEKEQQQVARLVRVELRSSRREWMNSVLFAIIVYGYVALLLHRSSGPNLLWQVIADTLLALLVAAGPVVTFWEKKVLNGEGRRRLDQLPLGTTQQNHTVLWTVVGLVLPAMVLWIPFFFHMQRVPHDIGPEGITSYPLSLWLVPLSVLLLLNLVALSMRQRNALWWGVGLVAVLRFTPFAYVAVNPLKWAASTPWASLLLFCTFVLMAVFAGRRRLPV